MFAYNANGFNATESPFNRQFFNTFLVVCQSRKSRWELQAYQLSLISMAKVPLAVVCCRSSPRSPVQTKISLSLRSNTQMQTQDNRLPGRTLNKSRRTVERRHVVIFCDPSPLTVKSERHCRWSCSLLPVTDFCAKQPTAVNSNTTFRNNRFTQLNTWIVSLPVSLTRLIIMINFKAQYCLKLTDHSQDDPALWFLNRSASGPISSLVSPSPPHPHIPPFLSAITYPRQYCSTACP